MREIQKVALIGAGAIGGYFVWGFEGCTEIDFKLIASGDRAERLRNNGLTVNDRLCRPAVHTAEEAGMQDLVIISTKYGALDTAIEEIRPLVGPDTLILSVLNGIDSEERVAAVYGKEHVLHSFMHIASRRYPDGHIEFQPDTAEGVFFGNVWLPAAEGKEAEQAIVCMLQKTNVAFDLKRDILYEQWYKYAGNVSANLPQAILSVGCGSYFDSEHVFFILNQLWQEVCNAAETRGVKLPREALCWKECRKSSRFSTLQDLDAGRHTEVDMFAGVLVRISKEAGLEAPYAEYTWHLIKALEEKNDGLFEYGD